jgi:predicted metalloprotease
MERCMKRPKRAIVLRLDEAIVDRIDSVRHPLRMDRTTWLRKAVARNLAYNVEHELPIVAGREVQAVLMP